MFTTQQGVTGPIAPAGPGFQPAQVSGPAAYYPTQTDTWTGMFAMMMPMIMMVMMLAMMMPLFKGITKS